jgi:hypothetical protein
MAETSINVTALDGSISVQVSAEGIIGIDVSGATGPQLWSKLAGSGKTQLDGGDQIQFSPSICVEVGAPTLQPQGKGAAVSQIWSCLVTDGSAANSTAVKLTVTDVFEPAALSVAINTSIVALDPEALPFTSALQTGLHWGSQNSNTKIWMPWGKGCTVNDGTHSSCAGIPNWQDPLVPELLPAANQFYRYGALGRNSTDIISIPIVTLLDEATDSAVSLALSVEDPLLEIALETKPSALSFRREMLRLAQGRTVRFTAHLVGHRADWRRALNFMLDAYPDYFISQVEGLDDFEGLGGYTWNMSLIDEPKAKKLGFKTNWDLSGTFMPYDGVFLPYQDEWENLGPINRYCAYTVHSLCTRCALAVHSLYIHYAFTIHSLCTHCTFTMHSLYTRCALAVHSLYTHYALTMHSLYTHCALTVHSLCTTRISDLSTVGCRNTTLPTR